MSGAVFLFEREATASRSEIRKQAVSPAADAIKTSCPQGGFFLIPILRTDCLHNTDCRFIKEKKQSVIKHI